MLAFKSISKATSEDIKRKALEVQTECVTIRQKNTVESNGWAWTPKTEGVIKKHRVTVKVYNPMPNAKLVWCFCTCPHFRYYCEFVLAEAGSSEILVAKNAEPNTTNPDRKPWVCKHVWNVLDSLMKEFK